MIGFRAGSHIAVAAGAGGIGTALVSALLKEGVNATVMDLPQSLETFSLRDDVATYPLDARSDKSVAQCFHALSENWDSLDGFVNLIGFTADRAQIEDLSPETWSDIVDGNLNAAFRVCQQAIPLLKKADAASLVNVTSSLAHKPNWGYGPYSTSKSGITAFSRMLAFELAPSVRVNCVAPSAVDTPFLRGGTGRSDGKGDTFLDMDAYAKTIPVGRIGQADDVVGPLLYLLSPASSYMTGQTLHVNGGVWMP